MESWFIYAIITSLCVGLYWFAQKIKAEHPEESDTGFIFYTYLTFFATWLLGSTLYSRSQDIFDIQVIAYSFGIMFLYTIIVKTRLLSLRYVSSSTYFINYRILSSLWLLIIWIIIFSETITMREIIWILVGFIVFYLLIEKKTEWESSRDVKKGFLYLFIWSLCIAALQSLSKDFAISWYDVYALVLYSWIFGMIFAILLKWKESLLDVVKIRDYKYGAFLIGAWVIFSIASVTNNLAFITGDLAIVYKIISYSLFIPIILSIIVYKEQVTPKKLLAFTLTLISILLFI